MTHPQEAEERELSVTRLMTISVLIRIVVDTSVQMFGPFLPIIAAGLQTNVVTMGRLLALRSVMGLTSPIFGAYADRHSYRRVLQLGLLLGALGFAFIGFSQTVWMAALGMVLFGLGFAGFVPTLQAYVSARLPYARRARGLGILEYSWALTGIVGLYLVGQLIEYSSWRTPLFILSGGMLIGAFVFGMLPSVREDGFVPPGDAAVTPSVSMVKRIRGFFYLGDNARSAYGAIATNFFIMFAAVQFMIIYGAWYFDEYGLTASELGTVALVFGLFDLAASVSVSLFTDAIGKLRSVFIGIIGTLIGYLLIPFFNIGLLPAVISLALTRGFFEFSIVSNMPLLSEQVPEQRGKVMTLASAFAMLAVTFASFTSPWMYTRFGIRSVSMLAAVSAVAALILLISVVNEPEDQTVLLPKN